MAEALNGTFKAEFIEMQGPWRDVDQVERAIFQWVMWYNKATPLSITYRPPSTNGISGRAWNKTHSPPEPRSSDTTKLSTAQTWLSKETSVSMSFRSPWQGQMLYAYNIVEARSAPAGCCTRTTSGAS
ncbi:hypothetical protein [Streptomyces sp. NPDC055085]